MKWYVAKIVFGILHKSKTHQPQFEDRLILLRSADLMDAFLKARRTGEQAAFEEGELSWKFIDVVHLREIMEPKDGLQLHNRIYEMEEARSYTALLNDKAQILHEQALNSSIFISEFQ